jgi:Tol biopolymer transport system component
MRVRKSKLQLIAAATFAVALLLPSAASAAFPGANGRIAYGGIVSVLPDGSDLQQLPTGASPSWSADGQRLVFMRTIHRASMTATREAIPRRRVEVFTMSGDGSDQTRVTHTGGVSPSFSPSGHRIAYMDNIRPRVGIYTIRSDGSDRRSLVRGAFVGEPAYSPDGERIAFSGRPKGKHLRAIWTIHRDGSHLRRLTHPGVDDYEGEPDWSPDGSHIVFYRCSQSQYSCSGQIYVIRSNGSYEHTVSPLLWDLADPAYSSAGNRIVFVNYPNLATNESCSALATMTPSGTQFRQITDTCEDFGTSANQASQPSWQPLPNG